MSAMLDWTSTQLRDGASVGEALGALASSLDAQRSALTRLEWRDWIARSARAHPLHSMLLEDPFVRHSATRPRGYPGDAELLDYIYRMETVRPVIERTSSLGRRLYEYTTETPAPAAVRHRSTMAAAEIDRLAASGGRPHILSVACGHLREARLLPSLEARSLGRLVAVDQDARSLDVVRRECRRFGVETVELSVKGLIRQDPGALGKFDFIYALGLYDYLSDETGARLLSQLAGMLNPGGKVWIANFIGGMWSSGFMESMMDWWLIYRSPEELHRLADGLEGAKKVFLDPTGNVAFLEVSSPSNAR